MAGSGALATAAAGAASHWRPAQEQGTFHNSELPGRFDRWASGHVQCEGPKRKLTVAELLALKGKRQIVLTTAFDEWTARAAEQAGVDMIVAWGSCQEHSKYVVQAVRRGAPNTLIGTGINPGAYDAWRRVSSRIKVPSPKCVFEKCLMLEVSCQSCILNAGTHQPLKL